MVQNGDAFLLVYHGISDLTLVISRYLHTPKGLCKYAEATGIKIHSMVCHSKALLTSEYWQCKGAKAMLYILKFVSVSP